ncbi:hypothetical protein Slin15195_G077150 [Septoria linicola]|uniref:Uncharacterized protein n=1 Tax=Septoria linicola TaxID=215465 RepID=A0A9Q9AZ46_9PEZI|nr:hypothetical protein Slin15195_G077150 [Septoria linicola]
MQMHDTAVPREVDNLSLDQDLSKNKTQSSTSTTQNDLPAGVSLEAYLTTLSTPGLQCINTRDWSMTSSAMQLALDHLHRSFLMTFEGHSMTSQQNMTYQQAFAEQDPGYHIDISNVSVDADDALGMASVIMQFDVQGVSGVGTTEVGSGGVLLGRG